MHACENETQIDSRVFNFVIATRQVNKGPSDKQNCLIITSSRRKPNVLSSSFERWMTEAFAVERASFEALPTKRPTDRPFACPRERERKEETGRSFVFLRPTLRSLLSSSLDLLFGYTFLRFIVGRNRAPSTSAVNERYGRPKTRPQSPSGQKTRPNVERKINSDCYWTMRLPP